jgi:hypothetical protein
VPLPELFCSEGAAQADAEEKVASERACWGDGCLCTQEAAGSNPAPPVVPARPSAARDATEKLPVRRAAQDGIARWPARPSSPARYRADHERDPRRQPRRSPPPNAPTSPPAPPLVRTRPPRPVQRQALCGVLGRRKRARPPTPRFTPSPSSAWRCLTTGGPLSRTSCAGTRTGGADAGRCSPPTGRRHAQARSALEWTPFRGQLRAWVVRPRKDGVVRAENPPRLSVGVSVVRRSSCCAPGARPPSCLRASAVAADAAQLASPGPD